MLDSLSGLRDIKPDYLGCHIKNPVVVQQLILACFSVHYVGIMYSEWNSLNLKAIS